MGTVSKKSIKPLVSVLPIEPKDIDRFWPLAEFMVAEALAFSGKYADSSYIFRELKKDIMQCWIMFGSDETEENKYFQGLCSLKAVVLLGMRMPSSSRQIQD